ncbi:ABC transporter ATP-binding protein [Chloroflexota bacterium]
MSTQVIKVENLVKTYGPITAVNDISFTIKQGEIFGMLGPNGAGKTTTVEIIEGLRSSDSGRIAVLGMDASKASGKIKQKIGIQLQAPSLLPLLKVDEILDTFAGLYRYSLPIDQVLKLLSLEESRNILVKNLSGGQKQRLSVAMALVNDPELIFLDEPTTGLDPQARRGLWTTITNMKKQGKTVFITTHYLEEAERLCDRVAIIDYGKIIALGKPNNLIKKTFEEKAIQFELDDDSISSEIVWENLPGATKIAVDGNEVVLYSADIPVTMSALLKLAEERNLTRQLKDLHVREATLEDVFLKITGRKIRE